MPTGFPDFALIFAPAHPQVLPGVGAVGKARLAPQVDPVVAGVRHVGVGEREVFSRLRVERRLLRERHHRAVLLLDGFHDLPVVDHLVFVGRRRRQEEEEVVPLAAGRLRRAARVDLGRGHVIDDDARVVSLAPFLRVALIEPGVVPGNEVAPLEDLERPGRGPRALLRSPATARQCHRAGGERGGRGLHEVAPREAGGAPPLVARRPRLLVSDFLHVIVFLDRPGRSEPKSIIAPWPPRTRGASSRLITFAPRTDLRLHPRAAKPSTPSFTPAARLRSSRGRTWSASAASAGIGGFGSSPCPRTARRKPGSSRAASGSRPRRSTIRRRGARREALGLESVPAFARVGRDGRIEELVVGFQKDKMAALRGPLGGARRRCPGRPLPARRECSAHPARLNLSQRRQVALARNA